MAKVILKRIASAVVALFCVSLITFFILSIIPGDAAHLLLGADATPDKLQELQQALGFDKPWYVQYGIWLKDICMFRLGNSYISGMPVAQLIAQSLPVTLSIACFSMFMAAIVAFVLGTLSAVYQNHWIDYLSRSLIQVGIAIPSFWLGMICIVVFGVSLRWFPISGYVPLSQGIYAHLHSIFLPSLIAAVGEVGLLLRTIRTSLLEAIHQDFIAMAKVRGLSPFVVYVKYAFRSALAAPISVLGLQFAKLLGGTVVIESVFSLSGMGRLALSAVEQRDLPLLQGVVMTVTALVIGISLFVDIAMICCNPQTGERIRGN